MRRYLTTTILLSFFITMVSFSAHAVPHAMALADSPPPPPRDELIPGERPNSVWSSGYWGWNGTKHVWHAGHWVQRRAGYVWVPDLWQQRSDQWQLIAGHWEVAENSSESEEQAASTANDAVEEPDTAITVPAIKKNTRKPVIVRRKKIDYSDTKIWPRYIKR